MRKAKSCWFTLLTTERDYWKKRNLIGFGVFFLLLFWFRVGCGGWVLLSLLFWFFGFFWRWWWFGFLLNKTLATEPELTPGMSCSIAQTVVESDSVIHTHTHTLTSKHLQVKTTFFVIPGEEVGGKGKSFAWTPTYKQGDKISEI